MQVRVGSFADGSPRLLTFNWSSCKPAKLREDAKEGSRPNVGRRPNPPTPQNKLSASPVETNVSTNNDEPSSSFPERGKIQMSDPASSSVPEEISLNGSAPHPNYVAKGPLITRDMFDKWTPELLNLPGINRPVRSTRNPAPKYVDATSVTAWSASPQEIASINAAIESNIGQKP